MTQGVGAHTKFENFKEFSAFEKCMDVNFYSQIYMCSAALDALKKSKGQIVCVTSASAVTPVEGRSAYVASKAAINGFLATLRQETVPFGVSVTIACPGTFVGTNFRNNNVIQVESNEVEPEKKPGLNVTTVEAVRDNTIWAADRRLKIFFTTHMPWFGANISTPMPNLYDRLA